MGGADMVYTNKGAPAGDVPLEISPRSTDGGASGAVLEDSLDYEAEKSAARERKSNEEDVET